MEEKKPGFIERNPSEDDEISNVDETDPVGKNSQKDQGLRCTNFGNPVNSNATVEPEKKEDSFHAEKISKDGNGLKCLVPGPCLKPLIFPMTPLPCMEFQQRVIHFEPGLGYPRYMPSYKRRPSASSSSVVSSLKMHERRLRKDNVAIKRMIYLRSLIRQAIERGKYFESPKSDNEFISLLNEAMSKCREIRALRLGARSPLETGAQILTAMKSDETLATVSHRFGGEEATASSTEAPDSDLMDIKEAFEDMNIDD